MRFDNIRCIKMLILVRQMKTHFSKEAAERMGLTWEMSVKAMAKKKELAFIQVLISQGAGAYFSSIRRYLSYMRKWSRWEELVSASKRLWTVIISAITAQAGAIRAKASGPTVFLLSTWWTEWHEWGETAWKDEHTRLIQHNDHHIILIKHENKTKRDSILWKNQEATKKMTNTTWTAVFVELE